ncbi:LysR family transcriptional regulator [Rhodoligotrophos defluvii]|uniref:LysR family transcriptional regulator n=1 Tax=Rhodoligotrophos defluvii TaxID=2561934 RepID=UPI001485BB16|nr:LysR family transcriptional regulator [Rhodoligotrophos defluvii]
MKRITDIDLRLLRVFVAVTEAGGYAGAQAQLNISSSTISLHMSDLESRIGFRLCERGRSGFRLTERGALVYQETKRVLATLDDFSGSMANLRNALGGRLLIGMVDCLVTHPDFPLARALRRFNELNHQVHVELTVAPRAELERAVYNRHLHAAIVPRIRKMSGLEARPVLREVHHLYCGRGHPFFDRDLTAVTPDEVTAQPFVMRSYHEEFDGARFPRTSSKATVHNMEGMVVLLLTGAYLGFLPEHYARDWVERGDLRQVDVPGFSYTSQHVLITSPAAKPPPAFSAFLPLIEEALDRRRPARRAPAGTPQASISAKTSRAILKLSSPAGTPQ